MHKLAHETIFLTPLLISSKYDRIFLLTNRQVVLMGLIKSVFLIVLSIYQETCYSVTSDEG